MKRSSNKTPKLPKEDKGLFSSWVQEEWQKWICERTHSIDSIKPISIIRDPNPHHAIIDIYQMLENKRQRKEFVDGLMNSLNRSLMECRKYFKSSKVGEPNPHLDEELLAFERHLHILNRIHDEDVKEMKKKNRIKRICRDCYNFVHQEPSFNNYGSLRRITLAVRSRVGDSISNNDLLNGLRSEETYVVAFRCALEKENVRAIGKFFPQFIKMALQKQKKVLIKVELMRLLEHYGNDPFSTSMVSQQLRKAFDSISKSISKEVATEIKCIADEVGIEVYETKPVKEAIEQRKPNSRAKSAIVYLNDQYVKGPFYNALVNKILQRLKDTNEAILVPVSTGKIRWDHLASFLLKNNVDFCMDPYFRTGPRGQLVNVVQYGWIKTFTCVINGESKLLEGKLTDLGLSFRDRIIGTMESVEENLEIGVLGETAATMEVLGALYNVTNLSARIFTGTSSEHLRYWLSEFPDKRIVICDHGVADDIKQVKQKSIEAAHYPILDGFNRPYISGIPQLTFEFSQPIPVGFVYPLHDAEWCNEIIRTFRQVLVENWEDIRWRDITPELEKLGIKAFKEEDLFKYLGIKELYDMHRKREEAVETENYENAAIWRDRIKDLQSTIA